MDGVPITKKRVSFCREPSKVQNSIPLLKTHKSCIKKSHNTIEKRAPKFGLSVARDNVRRLIAFLEQS
jgi:hypothetical protein